LTASLLPCLAGFFRLWQIADFVNDL